jgi:subtilisin family serine protease
MTRAAHLVSALGERIEDLQRRSLDPVEVAILDSGIDATHPDLTGRVVASFAMEVTDKGANPFSTSAQANNDIFGHGTAVGSVVARTAPNAQLVDVRVLGKGNEGVGAALIAGLRLAVRRRSRLINMSLAAAAGFAKPLFELCEEAYYNNLIIVAAMRNMPIVDNGFPAEFSNCISVGCEDMPSPLMLDYQNDDVIEFLAHGEQVTVAAAGGGYTTKTGTSFATPAVTGICALLLAAYPTLKPFELKTLLKAFAEDRQITVSSSFGASVGVIAPS